MKGHALPGWIDLKVEDSSLHGLRFLRWELGERCREGISNQELH
jgi:hypothetical protein